MRTPKILTSWIGLLSLWTIFPAAASTVELRLDPTTTTVRWKIKGAPPLLEEKQKKELSSGLSTRVVLLARLISVIEKRFQTEVILSTSIQYDLWKEVFELTQEGGPVSKLKSREDVISWIENPGPFSWNLSAALKPGHKYRIETIETLNPVSNERFEMIQKWVAQNRISTRGAGAGDQIPSAMVGAQTPFIALFQTMLKQAASGELLTGELRREAVSEEFTLEALKAGSP